MTKSLERIRQPCADLMATALPRLWPEARFADGPPLKTGSYYDVEIHPRIGRDDVYGLRKR